MTRASEIFELHPGTAPLLIAMPHVGTELPDDVRERLRPQALALPDTDWHVDVLYASARRLGCSVLRARLSRYVIDLNRAPDDTPMYAGKPNTGLLPTLSFDGARLYRPGKEPDNAENRSRMLRYWRPYHEALSRELTRIRREHGWAVLWDAHSIRSRVPRLFEGRLPDLNFGTNDGASCDESLSAVLVGAAKRREGYSVVLNGRFKGGYTTRHYGSPTDSIHAVQLEISQRRYLRSEKPPFAVSRIKAPRLERRIAELLKIARDWRPPAA